MNEWADHMRELRKLYGDDAPEKWRRIMRGMLGDPECRAEYEEWENREKEKRGA